MDSEKIKKQPLNVQGKYYVDYEVCLDHECCVDEASNNFKMDRNTWGSYIFKQPETVEEEIQCQEQWHVVLSKQFAMTVKLNKYLQN